MALSCISAACFSRRSFSSTAPRSAWNWTRYSGRRQGERTAGLVTGEIIAQEGQARGHHVLGMGGHSSFACRPFTVLFGMPVLRPEVLGGHSNDISATWANDHRCDRSVVIEGLSLGVGPMETGGQWMGVDEKSLVPSIASNS